jgi:hypothetical protein
MPKPTLIKLGTIGEFNHAKAQGDAVDFSAALNSAGGSDAVVVGQTSKVVTHGLKDAVTGANATPTRVIITPTSDIGSGIRYWVSARTATTFTVTTSGAIAGSNFVFDFRCYAAD